MKLEREYRPYSVGHLLLALKTFILVTLIWVFFRSQSFGDAMVVFQSLFQNGADTVAQLEVPLRLWVFLSLFIISDVALYNRRFDNWVGEMPGILRWSLYALLLFCIIVFAGVENFPFIYFQF